MEIYFHIPHIPLEPPTIKVKMVIYKVNDETLDHTIPPPEGKLFPSDYPWEYQTYTIADITNKLQLIPIPAFETFNAFILEILNTVSQIKKEAPNQWIKISGGWIFRGHLKVYRIWYNEDELALYRALSSV